MVVAITWVDVQRLSEHRVVTRHARRVSRGQTPPVGGAYGAVIFEACWARTDHDGYVTKSNCNIKSRPKDYSCKKTCSASFSYLRFVVPTINTGTGTKVLLCVRQLF